MGLVRTQKDSDGARGTHDLEIGKERMCHDMQRRRLSKRHSRPGERKGGTCQDRERRQMNEGYSLPGIRKRRELLGHRKKETARGALTIWRPQEEGLVRT